MKREIIIDIPNDPDYRVVCRWGYNKVVRTAWWFHLEKKVKYKKWIFFGKETFFWIELIKKWCSSEIDTRQELESTAMKVYEAKVKDIERLTEKAKNI